MNGRLFLKMCSEGSFHAFASRAINYDQTRWLNEIRSEIISIFPRSVTLQESLEACSAFWAWYFQQKKSISPVILRSIIVKVLAGCKVEDTYLLMGPNKKNWTGHAKKPNQKLENFSGDYTPIKNVACLNDQSWGKEDAKRAIFDILSMMECSRKKTEEGLQHLHLLIRITSFWIITFFRLTGKSKEHVIRHFHEGINLTACNLMKKKVCIPPPPLKTLLEFNEAFDAKQKPTKAVLTALIFSYVNHQNKGVLRFLDEGCMYVLNYNGLGLITWLNKAAKALDVSRSELLSCFAEGPTKDSYERILSLDAVVLKGGNMCSFSRLFKDNYLIQYSAPKNPRMCMACAFIATAAENPRGNPMKYPQFSKFPLLEKASRQLAETISSSLNDPSKQTRL